MSLTQRVKQGEKIDGARAGSDQCERTALLSRLRKRMESSLGAKRIAKLLGTDARTVRSEIKALCDLIFLEDEWRDVPEELRSDLVDDVIDSILGLGPLESLICDESVTEIMVNGCDSLYCEREGKLERLPIVFDDNDQVRALIDRIIGPLGRRIDEASPTVNARLTQGHRVHAVIPPLALDGPILTIRKFKSHMFSLEEMQALGSFDEAVRRFLVWAVLMRKNIAVCGGTGSGKTTLLNALSCSIPQTERIVTIEDSAELRFTEHPHVVRLEARPMNAEGSGEVTIRDLVMNSLRMRPDRIVVGECRGAEALDMLQAMNTGHDGSLTTLHANSPHEALSRLVTMVRYACDFPIDVIESQIAMAIDIVVQTARAKDGSRYVSEIVEYHYRQTGEHCGIKTLYSHDAFTSKSAWSDCPDWIDELAFVGIDGSEVEEWKRSVS